LAHELSTAGAKAASALTARLQAMPLPSQSVSETDPAHDISSIATPRSG